MYLLLSRRYLFNYYKFLCEQMYAVNRYLRFSIINTHKTFAWSGFVTQFHLLCSFCSQRIMILHNHSGPYLTCPYSITLGDKIILLCFFIHLTVVSARKISLDRREDILNFNTNSCAKCIYYWPIFKANYVNLLTTSFIHHYDMISGG